MVMLCDGLGRALKADSSRAAVWPKYPNHCLFRVITFDRREATAGSLAARWAISAQRLAVSPVPPGPGDVFVHSQLLFGFLTHCPPAGGATSQTSGSGECHPGFAVKHRAAPVTISVPAAGPMAPGKGQDPRGSSAPCTPTASPLWLHSNQTCACQEEGTR